jgi:hypothetical protein
LPFIPEWEFPRERITLGKWIAWIKASVNFMN